MDETGLPGVDRIHAAVAQANAYEAQRNRHDDDGKPYLAYYRRDLVLGFVWNGKYADEVQVTREMGEPIIATFTIPQRGVTPDPTMFKDECEKWIRESTTDTLFGRPLGRALVIVQADEIPRTPEEARRCIHGNLVWFGHECGVCDSNGAYLWAQDVNDLHHDYIEDGPVAVRFDYIGEGIEGDFDETDPRDRPLLRLDCLVRADTGYDGEMLDPEDAPSDWSWVYPQDGSICTEIVATTPMERQAELLKMIAADLRQVVESNGSVKRAMDRYSWLTAEATAVTEVTGEPYDPHGAEKHRYYEEN